MRHFRCFAILCILLSASCGTTTPVEPENDPYATYVWPPPPDEARIRLVDVISGRADVERRSGLDRSLLGSGPDAMYDQLERPIGVAFDRKGRILVTDPGLKALIRFDRTNRTMDVLGTKGAVRLSNPINVSVGIDGTIFVADAGHKKIVWFDDDGNVVGTFGDGLNIENPTDAIESADGTRLFVADSRGHRILIFDTKSRQLVGSFGKQGEGVGEFSFPTSLAFDEKEDLFIVDQLNARVQIWSKDGQFLDSFGSLGTGFGSFVRPKDVAVDRHGRIFVTDTAFNNVQLFNQDLQLLTFVGSAGKGPGEFQNAGAVDVFEDQFVIVDQLNQRIQIFRFIRDGKE